jgi:regulator of sigma E protease
LSTVISIAIAILVFGIIVIIHELGHFVMARKCGVLVEEFAIGMGPCIFKKRSGETDYTIRLFPVGGFCKMLGEDTSENGDKRALSNKGVGQRALILSGGAFMNLILAFFLFLFLVLSNGLTTTVISKIVEGSPAETAGLQAGDKIIGINGSATNIFNDLLFELSLNAGSPIKLDYQRDGVKYTTTLTPYLHTDGSYKIGFQPLSKTGLFQGAVEGFSKAGFFESLRAAFFDVGFSIKATLVGLVRLITFRLPLSEMSGPIGIVTVIDETYTQTIQAGLWTTVINMINLCGLLSANLGVFNLLPIPGLDGGRLVFVLFEWIRRKPVPVEKEGLVHFIGFVLLMILAVFIAYSDIRKLL